MADLPRRRWRSLARRSGLAGLTVMSAAALALSMLTFGSVGDGTPLAPGFAAAADDRPRLDKPSVPVRIWIPAVGIDLPIVSSQRKVKGNSSDYPLCDVAQYWTKYDLPGAPGTT